MIGVFDSGIGGRTVLEALRKRLPQQDYVYVADTAHHPYGSRSADEIRGYAVEITTLLCEMGAEGIVVACNTASAVALPALRLAATVPVWGMVDAGVEAATRATCNGHVAMIATQATVASGVFQRKFEARGLSLWAKACPALVSAVEEGSGEVEVLVRHYLREMPRLDTLLLGCTHFALVREIIARVAGPRVRVVDGSVILAAKVAAEMEDVGSGSVRWVSPGGYQTVLKAEARILPSRLMTGTPG